MPQGTGPAKVGFFSFTELTSPEHHRAYNRWHQLDHLPEQLPVSGIVFGCRWVSTPACRYRRAASDGALDRIDYMTLYLVAEPVLETLGDFKRLGDKLRRAGRFFEHRHAVLSGPFAAEAAVAASRVLISPAAVPYRPHKGVYVMVEEGGETASTAGAGAVAALVELEGVVGAGTFCSDPALAASGWSPRNHRITLCFLDAEPLDVTHHVGPLLLAGAAARGGVPRLAGPFATITPWQWDWFEPGHDTAGTDRA